MTRPIVTVTVVQPPNYPEVCVQALTTGITRQGLYQAAQGMPYRSEARKRELAAWLVKYRPSAVSDLLGWDAPKGS